VPLLIWKWAEASVLLLLGIAAVVEQFAYTAGPVPGVFTDRIPLFASVTKGMGLAPVEILLGLVFAVWLMKGALVHRWELPRSPVAKRMVIFLVLVFVGVGVGLSHGGKLQVVMWGIRPWLYLGAAYLLGASLLRTRASLRAVLWVLVLGTGFKGLQGVVEWIQVRNVHPAPEVILAHEESFFFGMFILICLGLWFFRIPGRLRTVATILLPGVLLANLANGRRTAWAIIGTTLITFFALAYSNMPDRRRALRRGTVVVLAVSAVYFPLFWSKSGTLAEPARALHSQVAPSARDSSSDLYRVQENANLAYNIRQTTSIGKGYGTLITYALPIVDISSIDPFISFIPHNSVLDLWMRLGILGMVVFLSLIAAAIFRACELARTADRELALLGTLTVCAVVAYVVLGYNDMGFFWFRVALCVGILLGAVEGALRIVRAGAGSKRPTP
jgi:O-antigen ligase